MKIIKSSWCTYILLTGISIIGIACIMLYVTLNSSLPQLDGKVSGLGVGETIFIERDDYGVPIITSKKRENGAYALGFVHAQERFFQMDLLRRAGAGELAALFGSSLLEHDIKIRQYRFRSRAIQALEQLSNGERSILKHYVSGVNAGLKNLGTSPFEYMILGQKPDEWLEADSLLVIYSMYLSLQSDQRARSYAKAWLYEHIAPELQDIFLPSFSEFDAPLDTDHIKHITNSLPSKGPAWLAESHSSDPRSSKHSLPVGSNSWAVSGAHSIHGGGIIANDMHLNIGLPNTWFRAALKVKAHGDEQRALLGLTLPGFPGFIVGSNENVAWGFTNSYGNYFELLEIEKEPMQGFPIKLGEQYIEAIQHQEIILTNGSSPYTMKFWDTPLGPIEEYEGRYYIQHWVALSSEAVNLNLLKFESTNNIQEASALSHQTGIPAQNITLVDKYGQIGWTIAGPIPKREDTKKQIFSNQPTWNNMLLPEDYPQILNPERGRIWSANSRQISKNYSEVIGDGGADLGARAMQIRDRLRELNNADESDVYWISLDCEAKFMKVWRDSAIESLNLDATLNNAQRADFKKILEESEFLYATEDSIAYKLCRDYMYGLYEALFGSVDEQLAKLPGQPSYGMTIPRWPAVVLRLINEEPDWLPEGKSWRALKLSVIDKLISQSSSKHVDWKSVTWGDMNISEINHPLSSALPGLGKLLNAPSLPQSGDNHIPKISSPNFGQSQRMVISPGMEELSLFNMPGGQSGHPLSPYYLKGHESWAKGEPLPLSPRKSVHHLTLSD